MKIFFRKKPLNVLRAGENIEQIMKSKNGMTTILILKFAVTYKKTTNVKDEFLQATMPDSKFFMKKVECILIRMSN